MSGGWIEPNASVQECSNKCHKSTKHLGYNPDEIPVDQKKHMYLAKISLTTEYLKQCSPHYYYHHCKDWPGWCAWIGEFFGTFALTYSLSLVAAISSGLKHSDVLGTLVAMALTAYFVLYSLFEIFKFSSKAHFNPGVTFYMALRGKMCWGVALLYMFVQLLAGLLAGLFLWFTLHHCHSEHFAPGCLGTPSIGDNTSIWVAFLLEIMGTMFLLATIEFSLVHAVVPGATIGGSLGLIHLVLVHLTGASVNFARYLGPYVFSGCWSHKIWVYFVADWLLGPLLTAVFVYGCDRCGIYKPYAYKSGKSKKHSQTGNV